MNDYSDIYSEKVDLIQLMIISTNYFWHGVNVNKCNVLIIKEVFDQAIDICLTALAHGIEDGTKTGFEGRIERLMKKQECKNPVY